MSKIEPTPQPSCCGTSSTCGSTPIDRRSLIKATGLTATMLAASRLPVMAGPFESVNEYLKLIPQDKKLDPAWVRSLFERGEKEAYTDPSALAHIGMPIGGAFAGTVYLSGDGRLWLWDIFNKDQEGIDPRKSDISYEHHGKPARLRPRWGLNYLEPAVPKSPFEQGFALRIGDRTRKLDSSGFSKIQFDGRYPMANISYEEADCPLKVQLSAFSPFIPLNLDDSSLPATVMRYTVRNTSAKPVEAVLEGSLENPVCLDSSKKFTGRRINRVVKESAFSAIECGAVPEGPKGDKLEEQRDFGSMSLMLLGVEDGDNAEAQRGAAKLEAAGDLNAALTGVLGRKLILEPGAEVTVSFAVTWYFPNFSCISGGYGGKRQFVGHSYAARFDSALAVASYLAENDARLSGQTQAWVDTWYDSTLPFWLLDRTMANTSILATTTCYRHKDGRFWAWEGVGCCGGTCTHVWHYAQAPGRLFPEMERITREHVDFGLAQHKDGGIAMRSGIDPKAKRYLFHTAIDGQCGRILGVLREHQMSADDAFLKRIWPNVRKAVDYLIEQDGNADGILEGAQVNTLDAAWYGKISFISSLYLAALRAGEQMALEIGDADYANTCKMIADQGAKNFSEMFNGEYFHQIEDPAHEKELASGKGCLIEQVFGQSWAHWVGLGTIFDREQTLASLRSLWKYNFVPDVGPFREQFKLGRWYAAAGDAGLLMCTWPKGGMRDGQDTLWQYKYFNECMSGFEHQVAAHMIWESHDQPDLLEKGLAIEKAIHDRYNGAMRNPYNEIECSDHYSRAMASYGVFQAVSGFECNGPQGAIAFAPRLTPEDFRAGFTTAEGWGSFSQKINNKKMTASIKLTWGRLSLKTIQLNPQRLKAKTVAVTVGEKNINATWIAFSNTVELESPIRIAAGDELIVMVK